MIGLEQIITNCIRANEIDFGIPQSLIELNIELQSLGMYPTESEDFYFSIQKEHVFAWQGGRYSLQNLPEDIYKSDGKRTHILSLTKVHTYCVTHFITFFLHENELAKHNANFSGIQFDVFERCYNVFMQHEDSALTSRYRKFWREVSINLATAIRNNNTSLAIVIENSVNEPIYTRLMNFYSID